MSKQILYCPFWMCLHFLSNCNTIRCEATAVWIVVLVSLVGVVQCSEVAVEWLFDCFESQWVLQLMPLSKHQLTEKHSLSKCFTWFTAYCKVKPEGKDQVHCVSGVVSLLSLGTNCCAPSDYWHVLESARECNQIKPTLNSNLGLLPVRTMTHA